MFRIGSVIATIWECFHLVNNYLLNPHQSLSSTIHLHWINFQTAHHHSHFLCLSFRFVCHWRYIIPSWELYILNNRLLVAHITEGCALLTCASGHSQYSQQAINKSVLVPCFQTPFLGQLGGSRQHSVRDVLLARQHPAGPKSLHHISHQPRYIGPHSRIPVTDKRESNSAIILQHS